MGSRAQSHRDEAGVRVGRPKWVQDTTGDIPPHSPSITKMAVLKDVVHGGSLSFQATGVLLSPPPPDTHTSVCLFPVLGPLGKACLEF